METVGWTFPAICSKTTRHTGAEGQVLPPTGDLSYAKIGLESGPQPAKLTSHFSYHRRTTPSRVGAVHKEDLKKEQSAKSLA